jgi:hypothetical protein
MKSIVEFCTQELATGKAYKGKHFAALLSLADAVSKPHPTKLGKYSEKVSSKNVGETAFQRALYKANKAILCSGVTEEEITWVGIELPIVLSGQSRRPCVDLIGRCNKFGSFLCELKYVAFETYGAGNLPDYAIFQAALYQSIVKSEHNKLDNKGVYRNSDKFKWKDLSDSKTIMILGNQNAWNRSYKRENPKRLAALITAMRELFGITVLLCCLPNYSFVGMPQADGRYEPGFVFPEGLKFPRLEIVNFAI